MKKIKTTLCIVLLMVCLFIGSGTADDPADGVSIPNDPYFSQLWALQNGTGGINAVSAWTRTTGSSDIIVAVIDSGVDILHPDLTANIWTNPGETENGADTDNNGYIDDTHGWNFVENNNDVTDYSGHGTHCAGIIGAVGNNSIGVTGAAWNISIMPLRVYNQSYIEDISWIVEAIEYAKEQHADIIVCSFEGSYASSSIRDAIAACPEILFICSAGDAGTDYKSYPASYDQANIISVTATNYSSENLASFSSYNKTAVDIAAPGVDLNSTYPPVASYTETQVYYLNSSTEHLYTVIAENISAGYPGWEFIAGFEVVFTEGIGQSLIYSTDTFDLPGDIVSVSSSVGNVEYGDSLHNFDLLISNQSFDNYANLSDLMNATAEQNRTMIFKPLADLNTPDTSMLSVRANLGNGPYYLGYYYNSSYSRNMAMIGDFSIGTGYQISDRGYANLSGSSMACSLVSGVAALVKSENRDLNMTQIKQIILDTADRKESLRDKLVTEGIVNASSAVIGAIPAVKIVNISEDGGDVVYNSTDTLTAVVYDQFGWVMDERVTWSSSNSSVAEIDSDGAYTAVGNGTAVITAESVSNTSAKAEILLNVIPMPGSVVLSQSQSLFVGSSCSLTAVVYDLEGAVIPTASVVWSSSASNVVSVTDEGVCTAHTPGPSTITVRPAANLSVSASVLITAVDPGPDDDPVTPVQTGTPIVPPAPIIPPASITTTVAGETVGTFQVPGSPVTQVSIQGAMTPPGVGITFTPGLPEGVQPAPGVEYLAFDITPESVSSITGGTITFSVPLAELASAGFGVYDVSLWHNTDGIWTERPTHLFGVGEGNGIYISTTDGYSPFAITFSEGATETGSVPESSPTVTPVPTEIPTNVLTNVPTATPTSAPAPTKPAASPLPIFGIIAGLGIAVVFRIKNS